MATTKQRIAALAKYLSVKPADVTATSYQRDKDKPTQFAANKGIYLVLAGAEADAEAKETILDDVWAFRPEFVVEHLNVKDYDRPDTLKSIRAVQKECSESCNGLLRAALKDEDEFVEAAISADGRGHFLSGYDGEENEVTVEGTTFYIYRTN